MARVWVTVDATPAERLAVEAVLGSDAAWATDGHDGAGCEAVLSFWPRREMAATGRTWADLDARVLQLATAGANHVPWDDVSGMQVAVAPGGSAPMVAEHVLAMILWWSRRLAPHDRAIREGRFQNGAPVRGLGELKVGLVGYGGIGHAVAGLLAPFGSRLRAVSRSGGDHDLLERWDTMDHLDALADWADVLVLCLPLVKQTEGLVDSAFLAGFAGERLIVNVARGAIIDEDALYAWLAADPRHAAALDVWWRYPAEGRPFTRPFHALDNVLMTPHDAPNVTDFRVPMLDQAARQLKSYLAGAPLAHVQDPAGYRLRAEGDGR